MLTIIAVLLLLILLALGGGPLLANLIQAIAALALAGVMIIGFILFILMLSA